jgi:hypothetical protein
MPNIKHLDHVSERAGSQMQTWSQKKLACIAKEVLSKSVVQSLLTYLMSCFNLTNRLCPKVLIVMSKFY